MGNEVLRTVSAEALREAAQEAWRAQAEWEAGRGGEAVPYDVHGRFRAVCQRTCLALGLQVPEEARRFAPDVEAAVLEVRTAWQS